MRDVLTAIYWGLAIGVILAGIVSLLTMLFNAGASLL